MMLVDDICILGNVINYIRIKLFLVFFLVEWRVWVFRVRESEFFFLEYGGL